MGIKDWTTAWALALAAALCAGPAAAQQNCAAALSPSCLQTLDAGAAALEDDADCQAQIGRYRECLAARALGGGGRAPSPAEEVAAQAAYEAVKDRGDPAKLELVARRFPNTFWGELAAENAASMRAGPAQSSAGSASDSRSVSASASFSSAPSGAELAAEAEQAKGAWTRQVVFGGPEPALFKHYFVVIEGSDWVARGAIVQGARWDRSISPLFKVARGHLKPIGDRSWHVVVSRLAYLGPSWRPEYASMSDHLFADGGERLGDFVGGPE